MTDKSTMTTKRKPAKKTPRKAPAKKKAVGKKAPVKKSPGETIKLPRVKAKRKVKSKRAGQSNKQGKNGRASKYFPEFPEQARNLCLLGATDAELAQYFGVAESTLNLWKKEHPEFSESMRAGKLGADGQVAGAMFKRAVGFTYLDNHVSVTNELGAVVTPVEKVVHPDVQAGKFWLKNRRKDDWRENYGITDGEGGALGIHIHETTAPDQR